MALGDKYFDERRYSIANTLSGENPFEGNSPDASSTNTLDNPKNETSSENNAQLASGIKAAATSDTAMGAGGNGLLTAGAASGNPYLLAAGGGLMALDAVNKRKKAQAQQQRDFINEVLNARMQQNAAMAGIKL